MSAFIYAGSYERMFPVRKRRAGEKYLLVLDLRFWLPEKGEGCPSVHDIGSVRECDDIQRAINRNRVSCTIGKLTAHESIAYRETCRRM